MNTLHFKVSGMHCEACFKVIALKVRKIGGVEDFALQENGEATLVAKRPVGLDEVRSSLQGTDYAVAAE